MEVLFLNGSLGMKSAFLTTEKLRTERQGPKDIGEPKKLNCHFLTSVSFSPFFFILSEVVPFVGYCHIYTTDIEIFSMNMKR